MVKVAPDSRENNCNNNCNIQGRYSEKCRLVLDIHNIFRRPEDLAHVCHDAKEPWLHRVCMWTVEIDIVGGN